MKTAIGRGLECIVYNVGDGRCYKEYRFSSDVDVVYENAKLAFEAGIAPEVYERDEQGYCTEIVETFNNWESWERAFESTIIREKEMDELRTKLCEVFGQVKDLHIYNIGRKNGKLVAIDFGKCSGLES